MTYASLKQKRPADQNLIIAFAFLADCVTTTRIAKGNTNLDRA